MSKGAKGGSNWADLAPRIGSAVVMAAIGIAAIWAGGVVFAALVALVSGLIIWEVTRMLAPSEGAGSNVLATGMGALTGVAIFLAGFLSGFYALLILWGVALVGVGALGAGRDRVRFGLYAIWVMMAGYGLTAMRLEGGLMVILWLVAVVIATDTAGYFAGKTIGGPKFWPKVSPKKTWSGTIAGWIAAGLVGLAFGGVLLMLISVLMSFASQMGDAAESALKRHTGIKDSSNLIPGHGGVFDRFDAMMGAALVLTIMYLHGVIVAVGG
ncbi:MAG: phosphatidate cytidylyltransferase [Rhodobacteraceae bacterium]|nr:phosphatidate cytidylyltransferase [Paracoccaceae bacterium]